MAGLRLERLMRPLRAALVAPVSTAALVVWLSLVGIGIVCEVLLDARGRRDLAVIPFGFILLCVAAWWTCVALLVRRLQRQREYPLWRRGLAQIGFAMSGLGVELQFVFQDTHFRQLQPVNIAQAIVAGCTNAMLIGLGFLFMALGAGDLKAE
jgi:hypothetical protein